MTSVPTNLGSGHHPATSPIHRLPLAVLVLDRGLRAVEVNAGWQQLSGQTAHDARGALWWRSIDPRDSAALRVALASSTPSDDLQVEHRIVGADGARWTRWWWQHQGDETWVCVADVDADRSHAHDLWRRATHDHLTGVANRTEFMTLLERALDRAGDHPALAVVYVDLDGFKDVNDSSGHRAGDAVLTAVAQAIVEAVRPFDIAGRLGGDEFAVLCPGLTSEEEADSLADRIRTAVAASDAITGIAVGASVGVAVSRPGDLSPEGLLGRADAAMYEDKARRHGVSSSGRRDGGDVAPPRLGRLDDEQLASVLVPLLFRIGLSLHAAADGADDLTGSRLRDVVDELDDAIASLRRSAFAHLRSRDDGPSVRDARRGIEVAIAGAERALHREWADAAPPIGDDAEIALRLVRSSRLLRAAERALDPDVLG